MGARRQYKFDAYLKISVSQNYVELIGSISTSGIQ